MTNVPSLLAHAARGVGKGGGRRKGGQQELKEQQEGGPGGGVVPSSTSLLLGAGASSSSSSRNHRRSLSRGRSSPSSSSSSHHCCHSPLVVFQISKNPLCWRILILLSVLAVLYISQQPSSINSYLVYYEPSQYDNNNNEHQFITATTSGGGSSNGLIDTSMQRCVDADDEEDANDTTHNATASTSTSSAIKTTKTTTTTVCQCPDPMRAIPNKSPKWMHQHEVLQADALTAAFNGVDVVVLGDSIVQQFQQTQPAFDDLQSHVNVAALGGNDGDTTNQLLFHLTHGVLLHPQLHPKMWILVVGTHNLSLGCSKRTTLAGILQVANHLHQQRPEAIIVLHGLFPRTDGDSSEPTLLNQYWNKILWINQQLKKFCSLHATWRYVDVNNQLLQRDSRAPMNVALKPGMMQDDGVHLTSIGYQLWADELTKLVTKLLKTEEDEEKENEVKEGGNRT